MTRVRRMQESPHDEALKISGERARDMMISHNLRLVVAAANRVRTTGGSLDYEDLIAYGNCGLIKAIDEKFDVSKGCRFSTGAFPWIYQAIMQAIYWNSRAIRVPVHAWRTKTKVSRAISTLRSSFKRNPTTEEICEEANISEHVYRSNRGAFCRYVSIDHSDFDDLADSGDSDRVNYSPSSTDEESGLSFAGINSEELVKALQELSQQDPLLLQIVDLHYGLSGGSKSIAEISEALGIPRAKVRGSLNKALNGLNCLMTGNETTDEKAEQCKLMDEMSVA